jgi:hypothetical protein
VVDLDVEPFFARGTPDTPMRVVKKRVAARRVVPRIDRSRKAGARTGEGLAATGEGTPPGGPWSPVLAHRRRDGLDQAVARRGQRCVRDADDGHLDGKSGRAAQRVRARVTRVLARRRKWAGKAAKRAGDRPWRRTVRGVTCTGRRPNRRRVRDTALQAGQAEGRRRTGRTRGASLGRVVGARRRSRAGGDPSVGVAAAPSRVKARDSWMRRRVRG